MFIVSSLFRDWVGQYSARVCSPEIPQNPNYFPGVVGNTGTIGTTGNVGSTTNGEVRGTIGTTGPTENAAGPTENAAGPTENGDIELSPDIFGTAPADIQRVGPDTVGPGTVGPHTNFWRNCVIGYASGEAEANAARRREEEAVVSTALPPMLITGQEFRYEAATQQDTGQEYDLCDYCCCCCDTCCCCCCDNCCSCCDHLTGFLGR